MVKSKTTKINKAVSSVQQFQGTEQVRSLTISGTPELADVEKKGKDVILYLYGDARKENRLEAVGNLVTITAGNNNTNGKTKIEVLKDVSKVDVTQFETTIAALVARIEALEGANK